MTLASLISHLGDQYSISNYFRFLRLIITNNFFIVQSHIHPFHPSYHYFEGQILVLHHNPEYYTVCKQQFITYASLSSFKSHFEEHERLKLYLHPKKRYSPSNPAECRNPTQPLPSTAQLDLRMRPGIRMRLSTATYNRPHW